MKKLKLLSIGCLVVFLLANCQKKDDNNNDALLLLLLVASQQTSGNCAEVFKSGNVYNATLTPIPRGGCNANRIYGGTTVEPIKAKSKSNLQELVQLIDSEFSGQCNQTKQAIQAVINDDAGLTILANETAAYLQNTRFFPIPNLVREAAKTLINAFPNDPIATNDDVATLKPASLNETIRFLDYFSLNNYLFETNELSCITAVSNKLNQAFPANSFYPSFDPNATGIQKNSKVLITNCEYGTGASEDLKCATLNNQF